MKGWNTSIKKVVGEEEIHWKNSGSLTFLSILSPDFQEQLALPKILYTKLKLPGIVSLKCSTLGTVWEVEVTTKDDTYCFFSDGWRRFVNHHSLKENDALTFEYSIENSCFKVSMFNHPSACTKSHTPARTTGVIKTHSTRSKVQDLVLSPQTFITVVNEPRIYHVDYVAYKVPIDPRVLEYLQDSWKENELKLAELDAFVIPASAEKCLRVKVINTEILGYEYISQLGSDLFDFGRYGIKDDKEEKAAAEMLYEFFWPKRLINKSIITYNFSPNSSSFEVVVSNEGKEDEKIEVKNAKVGESILKLYLTGERGHGPETSYRLPQLLVDKLKPEALRSCLNEFL